MRSFRRICCTPKRTCLDALCKGRNTATAKPIQSFAPSSDACIGAHISSDVRQSWAGASKMPRSLYVHGPRLLSWRLVRQTQTLRRGPHGEKAHHPLPSREERLQIGSVVAGDQDDLVIVVQSSDLRYKVLNMNGFLYADRIRQFGQHPTVNRVDADQF